MKKKTYHSETAPNRSKSSFILKSFQLPLARLCCNICINLWTHLVKNPNTVELELKASVATQAVTSLPEIIVQ